MLAHVALYVENAPASVKLAFFAQEGDAHFINRIYKDATWRNAFLNATLN